MAAPKTADFAALEEEHGEDRKEELVNTKDVVGKVFLKGGKGASTFGRYECILNAVFPECGYYLTLRSFKSFSKIYDHDPASARGYADKLLFVAILLNRRQEQTPRSPPRRRLRTALRCVGPSPQEGEDRREARDRSRQGRVLAEVQARVRCRRVDALREEGHA